MSYTNTEKIAIVLNLMGDTFAEGILGKLPRDQVERIQSEIIPIMAEVAMPEDIDAFVLDEIVRDDAPTETSDTLEENVDDEALDIESSDFDFSTCDGDTLLSNVDVKVVVALLQKENKAFQPMLYDFFPEAQQKKIAEILHQQGVQLPPSVEQTPIIMKMAPSIKQAFLAKLRLEASQETPRE